MTERDMPLEAETQIQHIEQAVQATPEIAGIQAYEYMRSDINEQKQLFIGGELLLPQPTYTRLGREHINDLAKKTEEVLRSVMVTKEPKADALYNTVEYRYAEMFMLALAGDMNDPNLSEEQRKETIEWFRQTNEALYGRPDKEIFSVLATKHITNQLTKEVSGEQETAATIQTELRSLLGNISEASYALAQPEQGTIDRIRGLIKDRFSRILNHIDEDETYNVENMVEVLEVALQKMGGTDLGWKVEIVPDSTALAVSAHQKLVEIGEGRKESRGKILKGKVLHELAVHVGRSINAEQAGWLSAAYGQDGYLDFEESFATALEDAFAGKFADHGVDYYLIAGLAYGEDNHEPRDFRDIYEIMWRQKALKALKTDVDLTSEDIRKAKANAFTGCVKLFRGTTMQDKGVVYLKDLAYFKGQELAWSVLKDVHEQKDLDLLFAGKLDLTKPEHKKIAEQILAV